MAASGKTIKILFLDGHERTFTHVTLDLSTPGWLSLTRLELEEGPLSGIVEPIAGYRVEALKGWEYVEGKGEDTQTDPSLSG